jgi:hypothetical protein
MNYVMLGGLVIGGIYVFQNPGIIDSTLKQLEDAIGGIGGGGSSSSDDSTDDSSDTSTDTSTDTKTDTTTCKSGEYMSAKSKKCTKTPTCKSGETFDETKEKCAKAASSYAYAYLSTPVLRRVTGPGTFYERPRINARY